MNNLNLRLALQAAALAVAFVLSAVGTGLATPGNGNGGGSSTAPGQAGTSGGGSSTAPGQAGTSGGGSSTAPGQAGTSPGQQATPPGQAQSNGNGANTTGPYDPSGVGRPSGNGNSSDNSGRRPCAGCVGNADAKNPPGQLPGGSDGNRGYECDGNEGVGQTNPAHSGCASTTTPPPENTPQTNPPGNGTPPGATPPGDSTPGPVVLGDRANGVSSDDTSPAAVLRKNEDSSPSDGDESGLPVEKFGSLPFTGGQSLTLALLGALVMLLGVGVRRRLGQPGALQ